MLQTYAKAEKKELNQIITVYQSILNFSFEELWIDVTIKHNKTDPDQMIDDINAKLINVCEDYLKENNIGLDKYQLSMLVMKLYVETISSIPQPFYVQAKESKNLVKDYVKANKEYMEKVKKVKRENNDLQNKLKELEKEGKNLNKDIVSISWYPQVTDVVVDKPAIKTITTSQTTNNTSQKKSKYKYQKHNPDSLVDTFTF